MKNSHPNRHLQRAWNKYGEENFEFCVIGEFSECELGKKEQYYISLYKSNDLNFGYNMTKGGDGSLGLKHTDESKKKISEYQKGKKHKEETKIKISQSHKGKMPKNIQMILDNNVKIQKPVLQLDMDGNFIKRWDSVLGCARGLGVLATNLVKCLKGKHNSCGGYKFKYDIDI